MMLPGSDAIRRSSKTSLMHPDHDSSDSSENATAAVGDGGRARQDDAMPALAALVNDRLLSEDGWKGQPDIVYIRAFIPPQALAVFGSAMNSSSMDAGRSLFANS